MPGSELEADTHVLSLPRSCAATLDVVKLLVTQAKRTGMSSIANSPNHFSVARRSCRLDSRDEHVFQYNPQDFRFVFSIGGILPFLKGDYNSPVLLRYFSLRRLNIKGELIELPTCVRGDRREFEDTAATSAGFSSIFLGDRHISLMT